MADSVFVNKAITLTSEEFNIVVQVNSERRLNNFSLAIRQIIQEWAKGNNIILLPPTPPQEINGNGTEPALVQEEERP